MFCQKCGTQLPDGAAFCPACGWSAAQQSRPQPQPPKKNNTLLIVLIALVAALFIAAVVLTIVLVSRDSGSSDSGRDDSKTEEKDTGKDKDAAKDKDAGDDPDADDPGSGASDAGSVAKAAVLTWFASDADAMLDLLPDEFIKAIEESGVYLFGELYRSKSDLKDLFRDACRQLYRDVDLIAGLEPEDVKVEFGSTEKDREMTEALKAAVTDTYADDYGLKVKDAAVYNGEFTVTANGSKESFQFSVPLIKLGSKWYVDLFTLNELLWEPFI